VVRSRRTTATSVASAGDFRAIYSDYTIAQQARSRTRLLRGILQLSLGRAARMTVAGRKRVLTVRSSRDYYGAIHQLR
jgi:hypothetical protein